MRSQLLLLVAAFAAGMPTENTNDPVSVVQGLVARLLGDAKFVQMLTFEVIPADPTTGNDVFELDFASGKPVIRGNTGVSLASGFHWYLKYTLNASIAWGRDGTGNQLQTAVSLSAFPAPTGGHQRVVSPLRYRYAYNVCTFGYSFVWYQASHWQAEIDRLAMWGVNVPLAFFIGGQEKVTREMYMSLGLNASEVDAFISGPAFLPWNRMGNMQGWGGPTPSEYWERTTALELQLLSIMRAYGMTPVLPGFAGHVPSSLPRLFPNASYVNSPDWGNFPAPYGSVTFVEPTDPLYVTLGSEFNKRVLALFGDPSGQETPIFNSDQFNEMNPQDGDDAYLAACNNATFAAMVAADPRAVYFMQGWLFLAGAGFWTQDRITAYVSAVPKGRLVVLDLDTSEHAIWQSLVPSGTPWIWNALLIFGGRRGIYGQLDVLASQPYSDRVASNGTMVGIGITPEAIDQSFVQFDLFWESSWRSTPIADTDAWLSAYAVRRYGGSSQLVDEAYGVLHDSNFNAAIDTATGEDVPALGNRMSQNGNATGLLSALRLLVQAAQAGQIPSGPAAGSIPTTFSYDLTDITRQFLWNLHSDVNALLSARYIGVLGNLTGAKAEMASLTSLLLGIMQDVDTVCAADPNFLLGFWMEMARSWANTSVAGEEQLVLYNAINQITLWGPDGEINDYAAKNGWSGLVSDYYLGRWSIYAQAITNASATGTVVDWDATNAVITAFEHTFQNTSIAKEYPTTPSGDAPFTLAAQVLSKYANAAALEGYTILLNTDAVAGPAPAPNWLSFGSGKVAVGSDCPFLQQGDTSSLSNCQASCINAANCNEINVESGSGTELQACVLRTCSDPLAPELSPYPSDWSAYGLNRTSGVDIFKAWHTDTAVLATLCSAAEGCAGFNSNGYVKDNVSKLVASPGTHLYIKKN